MLTHTTSWGWHARSSQTGWGSSTLLEHYSLCHLPPSAHSLTFSSVPRKPTGPLPEVLKLSDHRASYFLSLGASETPTERLVGRRNCCKLNAHQQIKSWCVQWFVLQSSDIMHTGFFESQTHKQPKYSQERSIGEGTILKLGAAHLPQDHKDMSGVASCRAILTGYWDHRQSWENFVIPPGLRSHNCSVTKKKKKKQFVWQAGCQLGKLAFRWAESCFGWNFSKPTCFSYFFLLY